MENNLSFKEYYGKILNQNIPKYKKIRNSYGVNNYYNYYSKNKPKDKKYILKRKIFFQILRSVNNKIIDYIIRGHEIELPHRLGSIYVLMSHPRYYFKDGKVKTNLVVNWNKTLKLWFEDKEAEASKILIKNDNIRFRVIYSKKKAFFKNKKFFAFRSNQHFRKRLKEAIRNNTHNITTSYE